MQQRNWRSKKTPEIIKLMESSIDLRLYLIAEKGPLSFTFQDDNSKKFFVNIGDKISCSCNQNKNEHCIHTIYTLNRMFKIDFLDPLILQISFTDSELSKMIGTRTRIVDNILTPGGHQSKNNKLDKDSNSNTDKLKRKHLTEDTFCSICQEDMYTQDNLFYCSESCGTNFHSKCIKIWMTSRKNEQITCPMCRKKLNEDEINKTEMKAAHQDNKTLNNRRHMKIDCKNCGRANIKGERFHCLNCEDFDICIECYLAGKHDKQHLILIKNQPDEKWQGIEVINKKDQLFNKKYTISQQKLVHFLTNQLKNQEPKSSGIDLILDGRVDDLDYTLERLEQMQINDLASSSSEKCIVCKSKHKSSLPNLVFKELPCGHIVHLKCSEQIFKISEKGNTVGENFNLCSIDKKCIYPGLLSLKFKVKHEHKQQEESDKEKQSSKSNNQLLNIGNNLLNINQFANSNKQNYNNNSNNGLFLENNKTGITLFLQNQNAMNILSTEKGNKTHIGRPTRILKNEAKTTNMDTMPLNSLGLNILKMNFDDENKIKDFEKKEYINLFNLKAEKEKYNDDFRMAKRQFSMKQPRLYKNERQLTNAAILSNQIATDNFEINTLSNYNQSNNTNKLEINNRLNPNNQGNETKLKTKNRLPIIRMQNYKKMESKKNNFDDIVIESFKVRFT